MYDIPSGFTGFTIDVFGGSASDSEGDVTKVLFAITYQERINNVDFQITDGPDDWSALMPTGEYISLSNPQVIITNRDSAIVQFDMAEKYPSNSIVDLCYRGENAKFVVEETDETDPPFTTNTITGSIGFTSNEYGGSTDEHGQVARILFNISFPNRKNEVEFTITEDPKDWAVLMGDGSYINLINPHVLFQNRNGATIVFQMESVYPSAAPGFLVRRRKEAEYTITEIDEDHPFIPVQQIVFPDYIPAGERINLHTQVVVYPMNSTLRGIEWSLVSAGNTSAEISNGWITTVNPGTIILRATIPSGSGLGKEFKQDITVMAIDNWITVETQPHLDTAVIAGKISEEISVIASTIFGELSYQWYKNTSANNESGTTIAGAQSPTYKLPKGLIPGEYYYFCEIRKVNFPSVRSDVATVRVRDELVSLSIYPPLASVAPGGTQQFAVTRNPQTSDENKKVVWRSSNHAVARIDDHGLATVYNPGRAIISATIDNVSTSINLDGIFNPVTSIKDNIGKTIIRGKNYAIPTSSEVVPTNASKKTITWRVLGSNSVGASIRDNTINCSNLGTLNLRATIKNGMSPYTDYVQDFNISVVDGIVPVEDIILSITEDPRVGDIILLNGKILPGAASVRTVQWIVKQPGGTGAVIHSNNLLTATRSGTVVLTARVPNGLVNNGTFTKDFTIVIKPPFVAVESIKGVPEAVDCTDNEFIIDATVVPSDAAYKDIVWSVVNDSGLKAVINGNTVIFDGTGMVHTDEKNISIKGTIKNGVAPGVNYEFQAAIYVNPPPPPQIFVPVEDVTMKLPSINRAYRPIILDSGAVQPWTATNKNIVWETRRESDLNGAEGIVFIPTPENKTEMEKNGVQYQPEFDWTKNANYFYGFCGGKVIATCSVFDGLAYGTDFTKDYEIEVLDPFVPVKDVTNIPSSIEEDGFINLSAELDTGNGLEIQSADWDDDVPTYNNVKYSIVDGSSHATLVGNKLTPSKTGTVKIKVTVPNGASEAYTWYESKIPAIAFEKVFTIEITKAKEPYPDEFLTIKRSNGEDVKAYSQTDLLVLCSIGDSDETLTVNRKRFRRSDVTEIIFNNPVTDGEETKTPKCLEVTNLTNFGRNFTNLTKINEIPETVTNMRNFLMGATKFNQSFEIPKNVNGDRCLEGFLRGCTSFNSEINIPSGVTGYKCMESFLRGCTSFNKPIKLPSVLNGDRCLYCFMEGCTSFNSPLTLPTTRVAGAKCMEKFLWNCKSFNQNITLPSTITGASNMFAFMFKCDSMHSTMTVQDAVGIEVDVIAFTTYDKTKPLAATGITVSGPGATNFKANVPNWNVLPIRKFV